MSMAYQPTEEDVTNVLSSNELSRALADGQTLESLAEEIFPSLDFSKIEEAALYGGSLDEQTDYANEEIARQLREAGILKAVSPAHSA